MPSCRDSERGLYSDGWRTDRCAWLLVRLEAHEVVKSARPR